ncbi:MAG: hypothetical protein EPGJADBJ_01319 [Saprospiraceae bacterium]|nr:hypothetical protein [Saprospiraceae bacterium]
MKHPLVPFFRHFTGTRRFGLCGISSQGGVLAPMVLVLALSGASPNTLRGQEIQLNEDPKISQLFRSWTNSNRANPRVEGWRIQIMATADRQQVEDARNRFRIQYPDVPADWMHEKPYYKLRVGAFRSRLEAQAFLATLTEYAGAYPARDTNIHPRDFLEQ